MHPAKFDLSRSTRLLLVFATLTAFSSCTSNDEFQERMDQRNDSYSNLQDRRTIRQEARDQRSDDWYERVMR